MGYSAKDRGVAIGGSDITTLLGINTYKTKLQLWHELVKRDQGIFEEAETNSQLLFGQLVEPVLLELSNFQLKNEGYKIESNKTTFRDAEHDCLISTPDGFIISNNRSNLGVWEAKSCRSNKDAEIWRSQKVPPYAHCQNIWNQGITKKDFGMCSGMVYGDPEMYHVLVEIDQTLFENMKEIALNFIESVKKRELPSASDGDEKLINDLVKTNKGKVIQVDDSELLELVEEHQRHQYELDILNDSLKNLKARKKAIENQLILKSDGASTLYFPNDFKVEIKDITKKGYWQHETKYKTVKISQNQ